MRVAQYRCVWRELWRSSASSGMNDEEVWVDAGTQIFFSWTIGFGTTTVLGSYNKFRHNSLRESMAFSVINASTSFLAGFIVFTILGYMAKQQGVLVSDVAESGPGLAFIAYPKAVSQLPISPLWSILFFVMLILLGLDSEFVTVESVITTIVDQYPHLLRRGYRKEMFIGLNCIVMFLLGLFMVTEGGVYVFQIFDYYSSGRTITFVALCEVVAIAYFYGLKRFSENIRMMTGNTCLLRVLPYFKFCWLTITPIFVTITFVLSMYNHSELTYNRPHRPKYIYPAWGVALGWSMATFSFIFIPGLAIYRILRLMWMGGRLTQGDFRLLIVPYSLAEHQKRPEDKFERCLADFEAQRKRDYSAVYHLDQVNPTSEPENA